MTVTEALPGFPAASVAVAVIELAPAVSATLVLKALPGSSGTVCPFTSKVSIALASLTLPSTRIIGCVVSVPSGGVEIATTGAVLSSVTEMLACPGFPSASWAVTVIAFAPSTRFALPAKVPPETGKLVPLTSTLATVLASLTTPDTITGVCFVRLPAAGAVIVICGPKVSTVTVIESEAEPAAFVAVAVSVCVPSASESERLHVPPETVAAWPFTVTLGAVPPTLPETATCEPTSAPSAGLVIWTVGGSSTGGVPSGIPILALPAAPVVLWIRTPNTQP